MNDTNIIGGKTDRGHKHCPHCNRKFIWDESWDFFAIVRGNTMRCQGCFNFSYLVPRKGLFYWIAFLLGFMIACFTVIFFFLLIPLLTLTETSAVVAWWMIIPGFVVGIWLWRLLLKIYNWNFGRFTDDKLKQSILDFK